MRQKQHKIQYRTIFYGIDLLPKFVMSLE